MASKVPVLCSNIDANAYLINKTSGFLLTMMMLKILLRI
nr:hypothetical protein [Escherichia coli]